LEAGDFYWTQRLSASAHLEKSCELPLVNPPLAAEPEGGELFGFDPASNGLRVHAEILARLAKTFGVAPAELFAERRKAAGRRRKPRR